MAVTLKDISKATGINICSVSQVLNNKPKAAELTDATREKIRQAAKDLGYRRNELARSIVTGRSNVIAYIMFFADYTSLILSGIAEKTEELGVAIKIIPLTGKTSLRLALKQAAEHRVDGVICQTVDDGDLQVIRQELTGIDIPAVLTSAGLRSAEYSSVMTDQEAATRLAMEHLYSLGHRRIACYYNIRQPRTAAYEEFMREAGLKPVFFKDGELEKLIAHRPHAVFCCSDPLALRLENYAYGRRIFIPDAFSVVGFGGLWAGSVASPALTTVEEPYARIGYELMEVLYRHIHEKEVSADNIMLPARLVVRESTKPRIEPGKTKSR